MYKDMNISCTPENPVEYLAALGIFVLGRQLDPCIEARWSEDGFELETVRSEQELLDCILPVLTDIKRWTFVNSTPAKKDKDTYRIIVAFDQFQFHLDWWYNSVHALKTDSVFEFSDWKLFAGNQTIPTIIESLITAMPQITSLEDLVCAQAPVRGRFGFDPLASQSALDAGYSPNNLGTPVPTSVPAELLSLFAIQLFFPSRCGENARGWSSRQNDTRAGFTYATWNDFLPFTLARIAAVRDNHKLFSERKERKHYRNLSPAKEKL